MQASTRFNAERSSAKSEDDDDAVCSVAVERREPSRSVQSISGDEHTSDPISRGVRRPSPFTEGERELIAAYVSGLNRCRYCHGVHSATAEVLGIKPELVDSRLDIDTAGVDPKMRPVLRYARKLTEQPSSLTQADADAIFAEGWEEAALYYTVAVTALFNFMNRLVEGMGIELDPSYVKPASERLARRGYLPLIDMISRQR
jgi:AhpD family alkylhydroperoxidase